MDLRGHVWKTVWNWNDLFGSEKGSRWHNPNKNVIGDLSGIFSWNGQVKLLSTAGVFFLRRISPVRAAFWENSQLSRTLDRERMVRLQLSLNFQEEASTSSPKHSITLIRPPLFQFNDFCFLATLNLIQGCQRIIVINQADHEDDAKLLVTLRSHIWIFVRLRTGNILFWPRKLSFLTKSTFSQSLSHGLIALFPTLKLNFLGTSYIDSTA